MLGCSGCTDGERSDATPDGPEAERAVSGRFGDRLVDGKVELLPDSLVEALDAQASSPFIWYRFRFRIRNMGPGDLDIRAIETEFTAPHMLEEFVSRVGKALSEPPAAQKASFRHATDPNRLDESVVPWTLEAGESESVRMDGHFYFAKRGLTCKVRVVLDDRKIAGPFVVSR